VRTSLWHKNHPAVSGSGGQNVIAYCGGAPSPTAGSLASTLPLFLSQDAFRQRRWSSAICARCRAELERFLARGRFSSAFTPRCGWPETRHLDYERTLRLINEFRGARETAARGPRRDEARWSRPQGGMEAPAPGSTLFEESHKSTRVCCCFKNVVSCLRRISRERIRSIAKSLIWRRSPSATARAVLDGKPAADGPLPYGGLSPRPPLPCRVSFGCRIGRTVEAGALRTANASRTRHRGKPSCHSSRYPSRPRRRCRGRATKSAASGARVLLPSSSTAAGSNPHRASRPGLPQRHATSHPAQSVFFLRTASPSWKSPMRRRAGTPRAAQARSHCPSARCDAPLAPRRPARAPAELRLPTDPSRDVSPLAEPCRSAPQWSRMSSRLGQAPGPVAPARRELKESK